MLTAHDEVHRVVPGAKVFGQVAMKSEVIEGRIFGLGQYTSNPDIKLDMLIQSANGVYCAIEVSGREHRNGQGPARDEKKRKFLQDYRVPIVTLELTATRTVPLEQWRVQLLHALNMAWLMGE
jgi:hypothetical protein